MDPTTILQAIALAEQLMAFGASQYANVKGDLAAKDQASIDAAFARASTAFHTLRQQMDAEDAAA